MFQSDSPRGDWTTENGVNGYKVTSVNNGSSFFLPATGSRTGSSLHYAGSHGYFWGYSPDSDNYEYAHRLMFNSGHYDWNYCHRYYGQTVRPVSE